MNKKKLFLKLLIIVVGISAVFLLSSCFTATIGLVSCKKNCQESCAADSEGYYSGNEYGIYYDLSDDGEGYYVSEVGYMETRVVIPETYEGKPVVGIKSGAFTHYYNYGGIRACGPSGYYVGLKFSSLTLPKTIKVIERGVFQGSDYGYYPDGGKCTDLYFGGTLEDWFGIEFGSSPFSDDNSYGETALYIDGKMVTSVVVPENVTKICENAFAHYSRLKSITFHENVAIIERFAFYNCNKLSELNFPCTDLTVCEFAFGNCAKLEEITFAGEKLVLEPKVFGNCTALAEVNWNSVNITTIPQYAFSECTGLETFVIPSTVEVIRDGAFGGCYNLVEIYNLSKLNVVAGSAAHGGVAYYAGAVHTSTEEGSSILTVGDYKFAVSDAGSTLFKYTGGGGALNLPVLESGESYDVRQETFRDNLAVLSVNIPDCVTAIGDRAFLGCENLKIVSGCAGLTTVGENAFAGCTGLESIALGKVEEIGYFAFGSCTALKTAVLPQSIKKLGKGAFAGTTELTYAGALEEWLQVELSKNPSEPVKVICSDGEVWEGEI